MVLEGGGEALCGDRRRRIRFWHAASAGPYSHAQDLLALWPLRRWGSNACLLQWLRVVGRFSAELENLRLFETP